MTDNPNEVTVDNSVLILIDHQPWVAFGVNSIDPSLLSNNLEGLASAPDFTSDERHKANPAVMKNGAGVGLALEQAFAQS